MAHTNQTPNYGLSEFIGSDKPAWLVDYNGDMEKIDLGLKAAQDVADAAKTEADQGAIDIAAVTVTANSADAKAAGAVSDFADAYDSTSTYNVGDFVIYNNILYRCITTITVPESFDGTHWARTTVEEIITQINSDLSKLKKGRVSCSFSSGYYLRGEIDLPDGFENANVVATVDGLQSGNIDEITLVRVQGIGSTHRTIVLVNNSGTFTQNEIGYASYIAVR
jgi:hypothetical protein